MEETTNTTPSGAAAKVRARMAEAGINDLAIRTFLFHFERVQRGASGLLTRDDIEPVLELPDAEAFEQYREEGERVLDRVLVIKLNGGLGTGMGLEKAKSLLEVRDGLCFLDLIARQILAQRESSGHKVPLVFMNSFRTDGDSIAAVAAHQGITARGIPLRFVQNRVPKIDAASGEPVSWPADPVLEWCPPGHGDLYCALVTSGMMRSLLDAGIEFVFVSNSDNLGAMLDPALLGYMVRHEISFMLEAADRTDADRKGGHLCRLANARLGLREVAQCPPEEKQEFQNIELFRYFNTNSIWFQIPSLLACMRDHAAILDLPTIVNRKTVDPRDPSTPEVLQIETAMGAALSLFPNAAAVRVPRRRFSPVKTTDDLLAVRSDAFELTADSQVRLTAGRQVPPAVRLDPRFFRLVDDFEARFPAGPPSLRECDALTVEGDVTFGQNVVVRGTTRVVAEKPTRIPDGTILEGDVEV